MAQCVIARPDTFPQMIAFNQGLAELLIEPGKPYNVPFVERTLPASRSSNIVA